MAHCCNLAYQWMSHIMGYAHFVSINLAMLMISSISMVICVLTFTHFNLDFFNSKCLHSSLVLLVLFFMCRLEDFEEVPVNTVHTLPLVQFLLSLAYSLYSLKHHNDFVCVFLQVFKALKCQLCKLHCHIAKSIGCMLASVAPQYQMSHHISIWNILTVTRLWYSNFVSCHLI